MLIVIMFIVIMLILIVLIVIMLGVMAPMLPHGRRNWQLIYPNYLPTKA
jgi:hypothetical protein